jgi:hypothetical protein
LDHIRIVPNHQILGMVAYRLNEILPTTLVGVVWGADDWERVEEAAIEVLDWLPIFLPFADGIASAQTLRKLFGLFDSEALERGFATWAASTRALARGPQ